MWNKFERKLPILQLTIVWNWLRFHEKIIAIVTKSPRILIKALFTHWMTAFTVHTNQQSSFVSNTHGQKRVELLCFSYYWWANRLELEWQGSVRMTQTRLSERYSLEIWICEHSEKTIYLTKVRKQQIHWMNTNQVWTITKKN